jgi:hypothetical protein
MNFHPVAGRLGGDPLHSDRGIPVKVSPLSLRFSERKLLLGLVDVLLLNLALWLSLGLRSDLDPSVPLLWRLPWFVSLSGAWLVCAHILGCYDLVRAGKAAQSVGAGVAAVGATCFVYLLIPFITPILPSSRHEAALFPIFGSLAIAAWRAFYATVFIRPGFQQRALVVGAGWAGRELARLIHEMSRGEEGEEEKEGDATDAKARQSHPAHRFGYRILGFIDDDADKSGQTVEGYPILGSGDDLLRLAQVLKPHEIVLAITHVEEMREEMFEAIQQCREAGVSINTMPALYESLSGRVPIEHAGRALSVVLPLDQSPTHRCYLLLQRTCDIAAGLAGLAALGLVIPIVWACNRAWSPGPLFYSQERTGKGGRPFHIVKFRSMVTDAEKYSGAAWAAEDDPRITPMGKILRKTRLDEVPQFWNILRGDMSLVGPRPERPVFVDQLT